MLEAWVIELYVTYDMLELMILSCRVIISRRNISGPNGGSTLVCCDYESSASFPFSFDCISLQFFVFLARFRAFL